MAQQTFSGVPGDFTAGQVLTAADMDKLREFLLYMIKDGDEGDTGEVSPLIMDLGSDTVTIGGNPVQAGEWSTWTPTLTNWAIGNGTITGRYAQFGKTVHFTLLLTVGSTTSYSGTPYMTLPVSTDSADRSIFDASFQTGGTIRGGYAQAVSAGDNRIYPVYADTASLGTWTNVSSSVPYTWSNGMILRITGTYEAA